MNETATIPQPWIVQLHTSDEILRELRHGWLHARLADGTHAWVTSARRNYAGTWLTVGATPSTCTREVYWGPGLPVWTEL